MFALHGQNYPPRSMSVLGLRSHARSAVAALSREDEISQQSPKCRSPHRQGRQIYIQEMTDAMIRTFTRIFGLSLILISIGTTGIYADDQIKSLQMEISRLEVLKTVFPPWIVA